MNASDRLREAANVIGCPYNSSMSSAHLKALIGHCAPPNKRSASEKAIDDMVLYDEDVFRANEKYKGCADTEIDARWEWVKKTVLVDTDEKIQIERLADSRGELTKRGMRVILKDKTGWYFRRTDASKKGKVESDSSAARAKTREEQDTEYAIAQVEDFIRESAAKSGNVSEPKVFPATQHATGEAAVQPYSRVAVQAPATAHQVSINDDDNYKLRVAQGVCLMGMDLNDGHRFANMVFASVGNWTVQEKKQIFAMKKVHPKGLQVAQAAAAAGVRETEVCSVVNSQADPSLKADTLDAQANPNAKEASSYASAPPPGESMPAQIVSETPMSGSNAGDIEKGLDPHFRRVE
jgi:hypothetical protein